MLSDSYLVLIKLLIEFLEGETIVINEETTASDDQSETSDQSEQLTDSG